ncbi:MAG: pyruvate/2-oxoglutarate/acetoin dehydrogenase E1 component, partial [Alphaproteobacteria bacterium]
MTEMNLGDAVRIGLAEEMRRDPLVWALGEDLSTAHGATSGSQYYQLIDEFGPKRIVNTPISENTIMGAAVGAAVAGTRPVADLRMADFAMCAVDELVNQAAKIRYMFGGQARVPLVVRQMIGARKGGAAQHSQSTEAWYVHTPGLVVLAPATPADAKGLLKAAIRCDDPVVYMEHKELMASVGEVSDDADEIVPIGKARIAREGSDLTIVSWSKSALVATEAAEMLAADGIDAEVIDLRSLWPWDQDAVYT